MNDLLKAIKGLKGKKFAIIVPDMMEAKESMQDLEDGGSEEMMAAEDELNIDVQPKKEMLGKKKIEIEDIEPEEEMMAESEDEEEIGPISSNDAEAFKKLLAKQLKGG